MEAFKPLPQGIKRRYSCTTKNIFDDPEYPKGKNFPQKDTTLVLFSLATPWNTYFTGFNSYTLTEGFYASSTKGFSTKLIAV